MPASSATVNSPKETPRSTAGSGIKVTQIGLCGLNKGFDNALRLSIQLCLLHTLMGL